MNALTFKRVGFLALVLFSTVAAGDASGIVQYTMTDLGTLGGEGSIAFALNSKGEVAGWAEKSYGVTLPFLYTGGAMIPLGTYSGCAYGINDSGQVVGHHDSGPGIRGFLYSGGVMTDLFLPDGSWGDARGINTGGQIAGSFGLGHAFLYSDGLPTFFPGNLRGTGNAINESGEVAGTFTTASDYEHAFLYSGGVLTDLGALLPAGWDSYGNAINASGEVVGRATDRTTSHAFLYRGGQMTLLGGFGSAEPLGINSSGQIVGATSEGGFLYSSGVMTDLASLVPPGWTVTGASAINDSGQICGYGTNPSGQSHAILLTPIPEPSTLALFGIGIIGPLAYWWRRKR